LRTNRNITDKPVKLENFVGSEIGTHVCFEIKDDYLYAVSNQTSFEEEEIDWTSYYICLRFPLSDPKRRRWRRIWRRQHREGPINDTWTDISLQADESSKQLVIVECRREWHGGGSESSRTYYMQPLVCFDSGSDSDQQAKQMSSSASDRSDSPAPSEGDPVYLPVPTLPDDPLTSTLDSYSKPNYEPPKKRLRRHYHPEYAADERPPSPRRDFIRSRTKYFAYNHSACAIVDLVNDPPQQSNLLSRAPDRLRLRIGSRKRKSPIDENGEEGEKGLLYPPEYLDVDGMPVEFSDERFESRGIRLWPPEDAPPELLSLLCPSGKAGQVHAASDERSVIYSTQPDLSGGSKPIILINFDPTIRFRGLTRLGIISPTKEPDKSFAVESKKTQRAIKLRPARSDSVAGGSNPDLDPTRDTDNCRPTASETQTAKPPSVFRTEPAMYLEISQGYSLR
jgi:hypothetical protein